MPAPESEMTEELEAAFEVCGGDSSINDINFCHLRLIAAARADENEACAKIAESFKRDASFDDSCVGAMEHNANQANIARAIRSRKVV